MRLAFETIHQTEKALSIQPTHKYIKFSPTSKVDVEKLLADTSLILFDHPLDYKIEIAGQYYIDPLVKDPMLTYRYATVTVDKVIPDVPFQVIEYLYKPNESEFEAEIKAFEIVEHPDTLVIKNRSKYKPSGWIYVNDNSKSTFTSNYYDTLKFANVRVGRRFWWYETKTNNQEYFKINEDYKYEVGVYLLHRNDMATVRGHWNEYLGVYVSDKLGDQSAADVNWRIDPSGHIWKKATIYVAVTKFDKYAQDNGIARPSDLNIWMGNSGTGSGGAPMFRKIGHIGSNMPSWMYQLLTVSYENLNNLVEALSKELYPDIVISSSLTQSHRIKSTSFHELAHASHFEKAGKTFWSYYIQEIVNIYLFYSAIEPYGNGSRPNAGYIAVGEAWGGCIGKLVAMEEYKDYSLYYNWFQYEIEYFSPYKIPAPIANFYWIPGGLFYDIYDTNIDQVVLRDNRGTILYSTYDYVQGIPPSSVYQFLGPNTTSIALLKNSLLSAYPSIGLNLQKLFNAYGY